VRLRQRGPRAARASSGCERTIEGSGPDVLTLGRDAGSDIVVEDRGASRQHARIEKRHDAFVLVDHSSNGTFVAINDESEVQVRREELFLHGTGRIALGRSTADSEASIITFRCE
jgi:pSer/pThr/pTyr-binding forkhead associated (FHA) protein